MTVLETPETAQALESNVFRHEGRHEQSFLSSVFSSSLTLSPCDTPSSPFVVFVALPSCPSVAMSCTGKPSTPDTASLVLSRRKPAGSVPPNSPRVPREQHGVLLQMN